MKDKRMDKKTKKRIIRRATSAFVALVMLSNEAYIWSILDDIADKNISPNFISAKAVEAPQFTNYTDPANKTISIPIEEFVAYSLDCQNNPQSHQEDNITIVSTNITDYFCSGFAGLGTKEYPFKGSISISSAFTIPLNLDAPLFNYVYDSVNINNGNKLLISRCYDENGADKTTPIIAKYVYFDTTNQYTTENSETAYHSVNYPVCWNIELTTPSSSTDLYLSQFGGFIGTMDDEKGSAPKIELSVIMNNAELEKNGVTKIDNAPANVNGSGDLGLACGHMDAGSELTFTYSADRAISAIQTSGGDVGGLVGEMENGAKFTLKNENAITSGINISTTAENSFAGGIVGKNVGGTVTIFESVVNNEESTNNTEEQNNNNEDANTDEQQSIEDVPAVYPVTQHITGTSGAGGVYGYYKPTSALTGDNSFDTGKYSIDCQVNGNGYTGGLFGILDTSYDINISGSENIKSKHNSNNTSGKCNAYGGLIGQYKADNKALTLTIPSLTATSNKTAATNFYGGGIGQIEPTNPTYVEFNGFTANASNASSLTFGGLVASADNAFIKSTSVSVNASIYKGGGLVGSLANGVLQISGTCSITGTSASPSNDSENIKVGKKVGYRDNGLVFLDSGASCSSGLANVDDIGSWGGILNYPSVLAVNNEAHTVTVSSPTSSYTAISNTSDFIISALNFQFDETSFLKFNTSKVDISSSDITLSGDVNLSGTGVYGLTRDNDIGSTMDKCVYSGTFTGGGNTVTFDTGTIYRHKYNGLFAKLNGGTVQNVTFGGTITVNAQSDMYVGAAAAKATGNFTANNVTVNTAMPYSGSSNLYIGGILGEADSSIRSINVTSCTVNANISGGNGEAVIGGVIGQISHKSDATRTWTFTNDTTISGTISNSSSGELGGLVAVIKGDYNGNTNHRTLTLSGVTINGLSVSGNGSSMGGLLGYSWLKTDVVVNATGVIVKNDSSNKPTIINKNVEGAIGGLVYRATGKWNINTLDIQNVLIKSDVSDDETGDESNNESSNITGSIGIIVNKGISHDDSTFYSSQARSALYLCLPSNYTYNLNIDNNSEISSSVFDELCAYTAPDADSVLRNGNGVISIATTFKTDGSTASGSYHARTAKGASANPNSRYYYNLDTVTAGASNDSIFTYDESTNPNAYKNQLISWGLNQYACTNLKQYFADVFGSTIANNEYDMNGYSWYPVNLDKSITVNGTFKFYNSEFEGSETVNTTNRTSLSTSPNTQHYTMHCGLFRNVASGTTLTVGTTKFQGNVGLIEGGSGALICGTIEGSSPTSKARINLTGPLYLDGICISGVTNSSTHYAPILINKAGDYVNLNISNVRTTNAYSTGQKAASSLIGDVGLSDTPTGITVDFSKITLDGRKSPVDNTNDYNNELNSVYGTTSSIFTRATLLNSFKYASGSTGKYDYTFAEDWNNTGTNEVPSYHHYTEDANQNKTYFGVTYGEELKNGPGTPITGNEYPGKEQRYSGTPNHYTDPVTAANNSSPYAGFDNFVPYVYEEYDEAEYYHQLRVNHSSESFSGDGTYNHPYIITQGSDLVTISNILQGIYGGLSNGIDLPVVSGYYTPGDADANGVIPISDILNTTWCTQHYNFTYDSGVYYTDIDGDGIKKESGEYSITEDELEEYLAGAYYKFSDSVSEISISATDGFKGLGNTTNTWAIFRGVIDGNGKELINHSSYPLIESSNGSVVKDLIIKTQPTNVIPLDNTASDIFVGNESKSKAYGAVIGKIFGGDNIIDHVSIALGTDDAKANITLSGNFAQLAPVGGYVGVVVNGGLYFRNMERLNGQNEPITYSENLFANVTFNSDASISDDNTKWLYINPIIGRVINGFAVTESGVVKDGVTTELPAYRPFEDGTRTYPDNTSDTWNDGHVTMQNGTKNYSIADIKPETNTFVMSGITDDSNITISSAQALYIMSLITESGLGKSTNGKYSQGTFLKPYDDYMATHNAASYTYIGSSDTNAQNDYAKTTGDKYYDHGDDKLPYIIKNYTSSIGSGDNTIYPAFNSAGTDNHYYNLILSGNDDKFYLPDSYRGLGAMMFGRSENDNLDSIKDFTLFLTSFNGSDKTVSLNMNLYVYDNDAKYMPLSANQACFKTGFGFINCLQSKNGKEFKDLTIRGSVKYELIDHTTGNHTAYSETYLSNQKRKSNPAVGAFVGVPVAGSGDAMFTNITLDNMELSGMCYSGGFIGAMNVPALYTFTGCKANNLKVFAGGAAGGLIGYMRNQNAKINADFQNNEFGIISIISASETTSIGDGGSPAAGGLIGDRRSGFDATAENIRITNVTISNGASTPNGGHIGCNKNAAGNFTNTNTISAGGIIGCGAQTTIMSTENVTVKNLNICGKYAGGMIGSLNGTDSNVTINNSYVITDTEPECRIESTDSSGASGGFIGQNTAPLASVITDSRLENYTIKGINNVGGLIGHNNSSPSLKATNLTLTDHKLIGNDKVGGMIGYFQNGSLNGYNILMNNQSSEPNTANSITNNGYLIGNNNNKSVKIAGFSRQGNINVAQMVGNSSARTENYGTGGYVIFADYNDKASSTQNAEFANVQTSGLNIGATGTGRKVEERTFKQKAIGNTLSGSRIDESNFVEQPDEAYEESFGTDTILSYSGSCIESQVLQGVYLYADTARNSASQGYYSSSINTNGAFKKVDSSNSKAVWYFEPCNGKYKIYTYVNGVRKYILSDDTKLNSSVPVGIKLSTTDADIFTLGTKDGNTFNPHTFSAGDTIYIRNDRDNPTLIRYLQFSGSGDGLRYHTDFNNAGKIKLESAGVNAIDERYIVSEYSSIDISGSTISPVGSPAITRDATSDEQAAYTAAFGDNTDGILYDITECRKTNKFSTPDAHSPFVTTNPKGYISATQWLTGDGVSSPIYDVSAFKQIVDDQAAQINKAYKSCPQLDDEALQTLKSELSTSLTEFKSYDSAGSLKNFPLLIAEDTNYSTLTDLINNYLRTLTNTNYDFADNETNSSIYNVGLFRCTLNDSGSFDVYNDSNLKIKEFNSKPYFFMEAQHVDTGDKPQFTLMDIQFFDPSDTAKIAYHLYVPVYVKKILRYNFNAQIKSGTDYNWPAYDELSVNTLLLTRNQGMFENLGNPVTIAFEWDYDRSADEWKDAINAGDSVLVNYYKSITIKRHNDTGDSDWPEDTKIVLVDVSNNGKLYYLDTPLNTTSTGASMNFYEFKDINNQPYKPVDFNSLMNVTIVRDKDGTLVKNDTEEGATVFAGGVYYRPKTDEDNTNELFTVETVTKPVSERYYITIFTKAKSGESAEADKVYHYEIYSPDTFSDTHMTDTNKWRANKINDNKNTVMHLFTGDLYENNLDLRVSSKKQDEQMSEQNDYLTITMTANVSLTDTAKLPANDIPFNMNVFKANAKIYQTFLMMYDMRETPNSTSKIGIASETGDPVASVQYYYKSGKLSASDLHTIDLTDEDSGSTKITTNEKIISTKYLELRNNKNLIDLLADSSKQNAVTLQVKYNMVYSSNDLVYQFPKKAEGSGDDIGSKVIGYSRIASTKESAAYSATSDKKTGEKRYYTQDESNATLIYNVAETPNDPAGPYSSLGINTLEMDDALSPVDTVALYDISKVNTPDDYYVEITFNLSNRSNYNNVLTIGDYLDGVTIYGKDRNNDGEDDPVFVQGETVSEDDSDNINVKYVDKDENTSNYEQYKVRVHKDMLQTQPSGNFIIPIKFNVKTGNYADDNEDDYEPRYANYKVTVSADIYPTLTGDDHSSAYYDDDHIIYTNAKVLTTVVK